MAKVKRLKIDPQETKFEKEKEEYIKSLQEGIRYSIGKLDDQILYISSGALALSFTFVKDLVPLKQAVWLSILYFSWIFLAICISLSLYSHLHSYNAHQKQLERLENEEDLLEEDKVSKWINKITMSLLILGIILQVSFAIINISAMPKEEPIKIIAPTSGEQLGLPVNKAPKSLLPSNPSNKKKSK